MRKADNDQSYPTQIHQSSWSHIGINDTVNSINQSPRRENDIHVQIPLQQQQRSARTFAKLEDESLRSTHASHIGILPKEDRARHNDNRASKSPEGKKVGNQCLCSLYMRTILFRFPCPFFLHLFFPSPIVLWSHRVMAARDKHLTSTHVCRLGEQNRPSSAAVRNRSPYKVFNNPTCVTNYSHDDRKHDATNGASEPAQTCLIKADTPAERYTTAAASKLCLPDQQPSFIGCISFHFMRHIRTTGLTDPRRSAISTAQLTRACLLRMARLQLALLTASRCASSIPESLKSLARTSFA